MQGGTPDDEGIYIAQPVGDDAPQAGPFEPDFAPAVSVEMMYPQPSLLIDEEDSLAPSTSMHSGVVASTSPPQPGAEELHRIREVERKLMDSGWHDDHNPKPLGKSKGKGETGLILSEGARARLEASVSAVVEEGERDANSLARCLHCAKWYPALDKTDGGKGCSYHPGVYRNTGTTISASIYVGWSCCKAMDEKEGGCQRREAHVEDVSMGGCMREFRGAGDPVVAAEMERRIREAEEREAEEEEAKRRRGAVLVDDDDDDDEDEDEEEGVGDAGIRGEGDAQVAGSTLALKDANLDADGNILHSVRPTDTLQGLSLRYGVSGQRIKEVNCILGSTIIQYGTLVIPTSANGKVQKRSLNKVRSKRRNLENGGKNSAEARVTKQVMQQALQRDMCFLGGGCPEEAKAYLELAEGDMEEAMRMYRQDLEWEKKSGAKFPGKPPVFINMAPKGVEGAIRKAKGLLKSLSGGAIQVP